MSFVLSSHFFTRVSVYVGSCVCVWMYVCVCMCGVCGVCALFDCNCEKQNNNNFVLLKNKLSLGAVTLTADTDTELMCLAGMSFPLLSSLSPPCLFPLLFLSLTPSLCIDRYQLDSLRKICEHSAIARLDKENVVDLLLAAGMIVVLVVLSMVLIILL